MPTTSSICAKRLRAASHRPNSSPARSPAWNGKCCLSIATGKRWVSNVRRFVVWPSRLHVQAGRLHHKRNLFRLQDAELQARDWCAGVVERQPAVTVILQRVVRMAEIDVLSALLPALAD